MIGEEGSPPTPGKPKILTQKGKTDAIQGLMRKGKLHNYNLFEEFTKTLPPETPIADLMRLFEAYEERLNAKKK